MKNNSIKNLVLAVTLVLSFPTLVFAAATGTQLNQEIDGVKANLTFSSEKLKAGDNEFTLTLIDKNGQPLSDPNLEVTADMDRSMDMVGDGMKNDEPMMIELKEGSIEGEYTGMVNFSTTGKWIMKASFDNENETKSINFNFNVHSAGPNWIVIGGFAGAIALIIVIAGINKSKSKKA